MTFYDFKGNATAYLAKDGTHIYLFNGRPVAYLYDDAVYSFSGHQLGWFENGWIIDLNGNLVFFTEGASHKGLILPAKHMVPQKCPEYIRPDKIIREGKRQKKPFSNSWSKLSGKQFFHQ